MTGLMITAALFFAALFADWYYNMRHATKPQAGSKASVPVRRRV